MTRNDELLSCPLSEAAQTTSKRTLGEPWDLWQILFASMVSDPWMIFSNAPEPIAILVAITRAQALLIVIGNPDILSLDPFWRGFLNYIHGGGGWRGAKIEWDPELPISAEAQYDRDMRRRAEGDAGEQAKRLKAFIKQTIDNGIDDYSDSDLAEAYLDGAGAGRDSD